MPAAQANSVVSGGQIAAAARRYIGDPYVWGASGPASFDCSGLIKYALGQLGISAPRVTTDQWAWVKRVTPQEATVGDLVFFQGSDPPSPGHVGIITGPGQMINAPYTGTNVRTDSFSYPGSGAMTVVGFGRVPMTSPGSAAAPGGGAGSAGGGGGGLPASITHALSGVLGAIIPGFQIGEAAAAGLTDIGGVAAALTGIAGDLAGLGKVITWLTLPSHWARIFAGVAGAAFLILALNLLAKEAQQGGT
jgi:hypothetical protein